MVLAIFPLWLALVLAMLLIGTVVSNNDVGFDYFTDDDDDDDDDDYDDYDDDTEVDEWYDMAQYRMMQTCK